MEDRLVAPGLCENGERRDQDRFLIVGLGRERTKIFQCLEDIWPGIEIIAPTEKRMVRPRRKSRKEPYWIERPLFMEYAAVSVFPDWERIYNVKGIHSILGQGERPSFLHRQDLHGMITKAKMRSWEGELVEIITGPMKGTTGIYERGSVRINMFSRQVKAKVRPFDISLA